MVEIWLPYGKTEVVARIPSENLLAVVDAKERPGVDDPTAEITRVLDNPVGSRKLEEIAKLGDRVAIVVDDATRPTSGSLMVYPILEKLGLAGVKDEDISIIVGRGIHRPTRPDEYPALIGENALKRVRVIDHDCDAEDLVYVGDTSRGTKVSLNRVFMEADVKILTGDLGFHYYAGYGGGRKSVLPAIASRASIQHNHGFLLEPGSRTGNLEGNAVHLDMEEAAHLANVDFAVNVVLNSENRVVKAFAGDVDSVFIEGVKLVDEMYKVPVESMADIVVTSPSGYPLDVDLYQAYKAVDGALGVVKDGGVVVLVAECSEGYGNKVFYDWMKEYKTFEEVEKRIRRKFVIGGHKAYHLLKALDRVKIILVSAMPDYYAKNVFKLRTAKSVNLALKAALEVTGNKGKVLVLPHGSSVLPVLRPT
jgi:nickel-dependent lactate racemase